MKINIPHTRQGFIALFFTLGISSILMAYITINSVTIFNAIRVKENFLTNRSYREHELHCADYMIDSLIRVSSYVQHSVYDCSISQSYVIRTSLDTLDFFFKSGRVYVTGTIQQGFISDVAYANFPL